MTTQQEIIDAIAAKPGCYIIELAESIGAFVEGNDGYKRVQGGVSKQIKSLERWGVIRRETEKSGKRKGQKRLWLTGEKR